jgi:hypothetical protein
MPEQVGDILAHFGEDHFLSRYQRYKDHIAEWRQAYPRLAAVDLRYDQQVVLQMSPEDNNPAPPAADPQAAASADQNNPAMPSETAASKPAKPAEIAKSNPAKPSSAERKTGAKPVLAAVDKAAHSKPADKPSARTTAKQTAKTGTKKPAKTVSKPAARTATKAKLLKVKGKAGKTTTKSKTVLKAALKTARGNQASLRAMRDNGKGTKRVEAKRAELSVSRQKPAPTAHRTTATGMGQ